jgi:hypothetical protein
MDWNDIRDRIKIYGPDGDPPTVNGVSVANVYGNSPTFTASEKTRLHNALQELFERSPTARDLINKALLISDIWLVNVESIGRGSFTTPAPSRTAGISLGSVDNFLWMGRDGQFQPEKLGGNIIHELIHAIDGVPDLIDPVSRQIHHRYRLFR